MKINELIKKLQELEELHGDIPVTYWDTDSDGIRYDFCIAFSPEDKKDPNIIIIFPGDE